MSCCTYIISRWGRSLLGSVWPRQVCEFYSDGGACYIVCADVFGLLNMFLLSVADVLSYLQATNGDLETYVTVLNEMDVITLMNCKLQCNS